MSELTFTPFMSVANKAKSKRGAELHEELVDVLREEELAGRIVAFRHRISYGRVGYSSKQFYAPFMIQFEDGERWLLYSTPSLRDRIKIDQWDAFNIKAIDSTVTKAYLVYPPDISVLAQRAFISKDEKYRNRTEYSALDGLVDRNRLLELIHEKAETYYSEIYPRLVEQNQHVVGDGRYYDYIGRAFEREVADVLANKQYLSAWKSEQRVPGVHYRHYEMLVEAFGIRAERVVEIQATANHADIGDLPSGGQPKTDVVAKIRFSDGSSVLKTMSCKRVTSSMVSAHQYKADDFVRVLSPDDDELRKYLEYFQLAGNFSDMPDGSVARLEQLIAPHLTKLCKWVVGGQGGGGEAWQMADYVVVYQPADNAFAVHTVDEYVSWLVNSCSRKTGGTPFSWTYQGKRGTNIQLKMPVLL